MEIQHRNAIIYVVVPLFGGHAAIFDLIRAETDKIWPYFQNFNRRA